jgi:hypothetical protein
MDKPIDLLVIDVRLKDGRGHVVLADKGCDPLGGRHVTLDFPIGHPVEGPYREREQRLVEDAQEVLAAARAALDQR